MRRRILLAAPLALPALRARAWQPAARPRLKISAGELYTRLAARFPVDLSLAGLLQLRIDAERLLLSAARQKLGATLAVRATGAPLPAADAGELDTLFALRYERADRTLRARDPEVLDLRWPGLAPDAVAMLRGTLPTAAREAIGEFVLHAFTDRELALPDTMGFEPGRIEVADDGLVVHFQPK